MRKESEREHPVHRLWQLNMDLIQMEHRCPRAKGVVGSRRWGPPSPSRDAHGATPTSCGTRTDGAGVVLWEDHSGA